MQEAMDHAGNRVNIAAALGAIGGGVRAVYLGHASVARTAGLTALSCAMVASACFIMERVAHVGTTQYLKVLSPDHEKLPLITHTIGGIVGGAWVGMYVKRPLRGIMVLTPAMMLVAASDAYLTERLRQLRLDHFESSVETTEETVDGEEELVVEKDQLVRDDGHEDIRWEER